MAKTKIKRWAVRECSQGRGLDFQACYLVARGRKPYKKKNQWITMGNPQWVAPTAYEHLFPEHYHLKPGGGPVEIEFADEE